MKPVLKMVFDGSLRGMGYTTTNPPTGTVMFDVKPKTEKEYLQARSFMRRANGTLDEHNCNQEFVRITIELFGRKKGKQ